MSINTLKRFEGIGRVKAIQIKATIELSKRLAKVVSVAKIKVTSPKVIFNVLNETFTNKKQEIIKTVILDRANNILSINTNAIGTTSNVNIGIKEILSEPIKQMASSIILVHNHPSGNLTPSKQDILFTTKIKEYAKIFNIELLDHIIIGKNDYISLKETGHMT